VAPVIHVVAAILVILLRKTLAAAPVVAARLLIAFASVVAGVARLTVALVVATVAVIIVVGLGHRSRAGNERERKRPGEKTFHFCGFLPPSHVRDDRPSVQRAAPVKVHAAIRATGRRSTRDRASHFAPGYWPSASGLGA